jgi:hypothetical protein
MQDNQKDTLNPVANTQGQNSLTQSKNTQDIQAVDVFSIMSVKNPNFVFQVKKTEKIVSAIYLVTNFIPSEEAVRVNVRGKALDLLSQVVVIHSPNVQKDTQVTIIDSIIVHISALLDVAFYAGFISEMNSKILKKELLNLSNSLKESSTSVTPGKLEENSFSIPHSFFADSVDTNYSKPTQDSFPARAVNVPEYSAPQVNTLKDIKKTDQYSVSNSQRQEAQKSSGVVAVKKTGRQGIILDIVKKKKEIMIKDISSVISDCSEKTIQRELLAMVEDGILKKEGERRWSKYTLA